jgi:hypothetical protein
MKKTLAFVSFLLIAAACTNQPATNTATNSNANTAKSKTAAPSEADMIVKEKAVWETLKTKDYAAFGNMLTSDYLEVTDEGVMDKAGIVADAKDFIPTEVTFSDWKTLPIDNDAVIVTYSLTLKATYKGTALPPGPYHAAAAWVNRDGKWLAFYYQQTPVKPMPQPQPSSSSKPQKAPASPPVKLATAGSDPIADEKLVWDAFKSKNYDGFAALLDDAFFEVESTGVYDKAAAVKGAAEFDATRFELSEWKSAKLDNNAALVTYLVKPMDPKWDQERHTSIWMNRSGKWLALLHVGTPVAKPPAK